MNTLLDKFDIDICHNRNLLPIKLVNTLLDKFDIDICHPLNRNLLPIKLVDDELRRYIFNIPTKVNLESDWSSINVNNVK
jgi:hypothetical protein